MGINAWGTNMEMEQWAKEYANTHIGVRYSRSKDGSILLTGNVWTLIVDTYLWGKKKFI
jgi:hypothetical protein